jgi:CDP-diacylglycerol--glycerol-3-phosphate 3-phosphatidyltransferase
MPSVYDLKPAFQGVLRPIAALLASAGVTANQVTVAACVLSIAVGYRASQEPRIWWLLPVVLLVRMALNAIDGILAREHGQKTPLGGILNELTDVIADAALLYPFLFLDPWWMAATIFLAALTEMAGLACVLANADRRYDGPFGKSDRALAFGVLAAIYAMGWQLRPEIEQAIPKLTAFLCAVTVVNRVRCALS